jgi:hypothetical protein
MSTQGFHRFPIKRFRFDGSGMNNELNKEEKIDLHDKANVIAIVPLSFSQKMHKVGEV